MVIGLLVALVTATYVQELPQQLIVLGATATTAFIFVGYLVAQLGLSLRCVAP